MIPLILKLKKTRHKEIAKAQDLIVEELYKIFDKAVLHGGTVIWRCYQGNRFSEDVDVYLSKYPEKINTLFTNLERRGFLVEKKKVSQNSLCSALQWDRVTIRLEALFKKIDGTLKEYETSEGNFITVYTLSAEELVKEKINAYLKRRKIRDLYDIFFLLRHVKSKDKIVKELEILVKRFKEPLDEEELKVLIIDGIAPDARKMLEYIKDYTR